MKVRMAVIGELFTKPVVILGCGNTLLGDDGFGPEVIEHLHTYYKIPENVLAMDAGTSAGDILFDFVLSPVRPRHLFIVDAVTSGGVEPGEIFEVPVERVPEGGTGGFNPHQVPSMSLLRELKFSAGVDVRILAVRAVAVPEFVQPGLSPEVRAAVDRACTWLFRQIGETPGGCRSKE